MPRLIERPVFCTQDTAIGRMSSRRLSGNSWITMRLLKYPEAAEYLRISESSLRRLVKKGIIAAFWLNRSVRFDQAKLDEAIGESVKVKTRMRKEKQQRKEQVA